MPNWKTLEAREKLLAATVASLDIKALNYKRIATFYGEGTTYDSIEGQFRNIRKIAVQLKAAVESGEHPEAPDRGTTGTRANAGPSRGAVKNEPTPTAAKLDSTPVKKEAGHGRMDVTPKKNRSPAATKKTPPSARRDGVLSGRVAKGTTPTGNVAGTGSSGTGSFGHGHAVGTSAYGHAGGASAYGPAGTNPVCFSVNQGAATRGGFVMGVKQEPESSAESAPQSSADSAAPSPQDGFDVGGFGLGADFGPGAFDGVLEQTYGAGFFDEFEA